MKIVKSIFRTLVCGLLILAVGYGGILLCGKRVLHSATEPERITMDADISNLFYSKMEDDILLYPWNYCPKEEAEEVSFMDYSPYVENDVFYNLIAMAAEVETQEVSSWYSGQNQTIMNSMKQGEETDGTKNNLFFYDEVIRLSGKDYQVKISCTPYSIISFSCMQYRGEEELDSAEWHSQKELFMSWMEENPEVMAMAWERLYTLLYKVNTVEEWYEYVTLYQYYKREVSALRSGSLKIHKSAENGCVVEAVQTDEGNSSFVSVQEEYSQLPIQMIEVKDSMLVIMQADITVGLYYDILNQRIVGFHYFYE